MRRQWVGGQWLKSNRKRIAVINPATEEVIDHIPRGTAADADRAVRAAREAFNTWRWVPADRSALNCRASVPLAVVP
jgi:acyl-CoA reductase-like NAD-dependent aldehyde dehydrogenase